MSVDHNDGETAKRWSKMEARDMSTAMTYAELTEAKYRSVNELGREQYE